VVAQQERDHRAADGSHVGRQQRLVRRAAHQPAGDRSGRVFYDWKWQGVWQYADSVAMKAFNANGSTFKAGDPRVADINNDGKINADDRMIVGTSYPKWIGSFYNRFAGRASTSRPADVEGGLHIHGRHAAELHRRLGVIADMDYWMPNNPTNKNPAPNLGQVERTYATTRLYTDGSHWRVRNLTFGYTMNAPRWQDRRAEHPVLRHRAGPVHRVELPWHRSGSCGRRTNAAHDPDRHEHLLVDETTTMTRTQMKRILLGTVTLGIAALAGCVDLDEKLITGVSSEYYSTPDGLNAAVVASYSQLRGYYGREQLISLAQAGTDTWSDADQAGSNNREFGGYTGGMNSTVAPLANTWNPAYQMINTLNAALDRGPSTSGIPAATRTLAGRSALPARLRILHAGADVWQRDALDAREQGCRGPGVRDTAPKVYEAILADLDSADHVVAVTQARSGRATRGAARALRSKVYLTRAYRAYSPNKQADFQRASTTRRPLSPPAPTRSRRTTPISGAWPRQRIRDDRASARTPDTTPHNQNSSSPCSSRTTSRTTTAATSTTICTWCTSASTTTTRSASASHVT
jgi:hypothetical protein